MPRLNLLLSFLCVSVIHPVISECEFPDLKWVTPPGNDYPYFSGTIIYEGFDCDNSWDCQPTLTGLGCSEYCESQPVDLVCDYGKRWQPCDAPMQGACVACQQEGDEAIRGGYSFGVNEHTTEGYDLLNRRGSFEYSKIYPKSGMATRNAVQIVDGANMATSSTPAVLWADVTFPGDRSQNMRWYGVGNLKLHYYSGQGALQSDVFLVMDAPYARMVICGIDTSNMQETWNPVGEVDHMRGLLYEFQYRQRAQSDNNHISVTVALQSNVNNDMLIHDQFELQSRDVWTRTQGLLDYSRVYGGSASDLIEKFGCLKLEFKMAIGKEVLIDELRVFANLIGNSQFLTTGYWTFQSEDSPGVTRLDEITTTANGYASLHPGERISQVVFPRTDATHIANAVFSMDVRGSGMLLVTVNPDVNPLTEVILFRKDITDSLDGASVWQSFTLPVTLLVPDPDTDMFWFTLEHYDVGETTSVLEIDNVILYVDPRRCPVSACDDPNQRVFLNGKCETCKGDNGTLVAACQAGQWQNGCTVARSGIQAKCTVCPTVQDAGDGHFELVAVAVEGAIRGLECPFTCDEGFFYSRIGSSNSGPICTQCTPQTSLQCHVGWYMAECAGETDRVCKPCEVLDVYDNSVVYTTDPSNILQCTHACSPGQFQHGVRVDTGVAMCFKCTAGICGAKDDGMSAPRFRDGIQYTSACSAYKDSRCTTCVSKDPNIRFTDNGRVVGAWCAYECTAGFQSCASCAWDPAQATSIAIGSGTEALNLGMTPFNDSFVLRFSGHARISTAAFDTRVVLKVHVESRTKLGGVLDSVWNPPNGTGVVVELFPVVPPSALASMSQADSFINDAPVQGFDTTVEMRDFINTHNFSNWNTNRIANGMALYLVYQLIVESTVAEHITVLNFTVENMTRAVDCCEERDLFTHVKVDPAMVYRCQPCEMATGANATLPADAHWVQGNSSCMWECDKHFERAAGGDTCQFCIQPICRTGTYWTDCGRCENCTSILPTKSAFTGNGTIRRDGGSCPFRCVEDFYYRSADRVCAPCTPSTNLNCSTLPGGPFFEIECGAFEDTFCMNCFTCPPGSNASTPCGRFTDVVCTACNALQVNMPALGAEWRLSASVDEYCAWECASGLQYNSLENTCFACLNDVCPIGTYPTPCTLEYNFSACLPCLTPKNAVLISTGHISLVHSCAWECNASYVYEQMTGDCIPQPVVPVVSIHTETPETICKGTLPSLCEWGQLFDTSISISDGPCDAMCVSCPTLPTIVGVNEGPRMYTHRGSCEWVCSHPFIKIAGKCIRVPTQI